MILQANCKINIGLHVVRRRPDGYHDLQTLFYPVYNLYDELEITPLPYHSEDIAFDMDGIKVDCSAEDNLVMRCYRLMKQRYPQISAVQIRLKKNIPFGAGLGGGSSDAAHTAIALNSLFQLGLNREQLAMEVRPLGADCPFFIYNEPCFATGIGEVLTPTPLRLTGWRIMMIKPPVSVSTREAYAGVRPDGNEYPWQSDGNDWLTYRNDFEHSVFAQYPLLNDIKHALYDAGATYTAMSGSGSTIYALWSPHSPMIQKNDTAFSEWIIYDGTL